LGANHEQRPMGSLDPNRVHPLKPRVLASRRVAQHKSSPGRCSLLIYTSPKELSLLNRLRVTSPDDCHPTLDYSASYYLGDPRYSGPLIQTRVDQRPGPGLPTFCSPPALGSLGQPTTSPFGSVTEQPTRNGLSHDFTRVRMTPPGTCVPVISSWRNGEDPVRWIVTSPSLLKYRTVSVTFISGKL